MTNKVTENEPRSGNTASSESNAPIASSIESDDSNRKACSPNALKPDDEMMCTFLTSIPAGLTTICAIPAKGGNPTGKTFDLPAEAGAAVEWASSRNAKGNGVYWTVNPSLSRIAKKPKKTDIAHGRFLHRDIDPSKDPTVPYADRHAVIEAEIESFRHKQPVPTIIIDSGHGCYPIYLLERPADEATTEEANRQIGRNDGDGTWNIDRLLRLPGSVNWPQPKKVSHKGYPSEAVMCTLLRCGMESYSIDLFLKPTADQEDPFVTSMVIAAEVATIDIQSLPKVLQRKIKIDPPDGERSEVFHHVVCWLGDLGYAVDCIVLLLQSWPSGIAVKYQDRLGEEVQRSFAKRKESVKSAYTRKQLAGMIDETAEFDRLTKEILLLVYEATLSDSERLSLLKFIAKKSGVSVKSLKADARNFDLVEAGKDSLHLFAAREVVKMLGRNNLLHAKGNLWRWKGDGVWRLLDDRDVKQLIHDVADSSKLTASIVTSILDLVKTEAHLPGHRFDVDVARINCLTGEIEYRDSAAAWRLTPHVRKHFRTTMIPIVYDAQATAPRFEQFLQEVFAGDIDASDKASIVEEALGYSLISSCHLEKFLMLVGNGANGKSVLLAILAALLGPEHICAVQPNQFDSKFQRGHLFGKLANIITEIAQGGEIADDKLKSLVSGELTTAEHKFKDPFDFIPIATHWFGTNHLPHTRDFSEALFRRAIILNFNNKFENANRDVHLIGKLKAELPGILNHALRGLTRLIENGAFTEATSSEEAKQQWKVEADQARQFVEERCEIGNQYHCASGEIYGSYKEWAEVAGIRLTLTRNNLTVRLKAIGFEAKKVTNGQREIVGLQLKRASDNYGYAMRRG
jgi:P4 family phage/plasmid primase-like protien